MPYVTYAEFNVPDTGKAAKFYKDVFGWEAQSWDDSGYMVVGHGEEPGIDVGLTPMQGDAPSTVAVVTVPDIDKTLEAAKKAGATVVVEKFPIEGVGHAAYFTDPSGMMVGVHQRE